MNLYENRMYIRKIIKVGSSKAITLPPKWLRKIKTDFVIIVENSDNSLTIKPFQQKE